MVDGGRGLQEEKERGEREKEDDGDV